ncbi:MAG TPA: ubiquinol-cytochrome c reductase iron-sulfur subunit [Vineibacter sp.]|nr:ubiquinol-cytochrome c reductase iron-sulfur subunit [Vineibacter sp.]
MATSSTSATVSGAAGHGDVSRRDFLFIATGATAAVGTAAAIWPFLNNMNPAADTLALASIEVSLNGIEVGQAIKVSWRGKPVFIRRRTAEEIKAARDVNMKDLPDPEDDAKRVQKGKDEWLILVGVCTHLGCVPLGTAQGETKGDYKGWFCPCHGSHYDTSGRIRKGPAPKNLEVPLYTYLNDTTIKIG